MSSGSDTLRKNISQEQRFADHVGRYWFGWFSVIYGLFVGLPFLAPVLMQIGVELPGKIIYAIYSFVCHQLPERSFFLFGQKSMYSLAEIQYFWKQTIDPAILRQFIGYPTVGWKVAWSDRMFSLYSSILLFAWLWWPLRMRIRPLRLYGFILLALPMVIDGVSHTISDFAGLNLGFRCTNTWLVNLTQNAYPGWFYYGDAFGSFNSWMRLISGALFGLGFVGFLFPIIERHFSAERLLLQARQGLRDRLLQGSSGVPQSPSDVVRIGDTKK